MVAPLSTDIRSLAESIKASEPVITDGVMEQLVETLQRLQAKVCDAGDVKRFYKYKTLKTHLLPITNIAFDKLGKRYSRFCPLSRPLYGRESTYTGFAPAGRHFCAKSHRSVRVCLLAPSICAPRKLNSRWCTLVEKIPSYIKGCFPLFILICRS